MNYIKFSANYLCNVHSKFPLLKTKPHIHHESTPSKETCKYPVDIAIIKLEKNIFCQKIKQRDVEREGEIKRKREKRENVLIGEVMQKAL